jgi:hypothetical protein
MVSLNGLPGSRSAAAIKKLENDMKGFFQNLLRNNVAKLKHAHFCQYYRYTTFIPPMEHPSKFSNPGFRGSIIQLAMKMRKNELSTPMETNIKQLTQCQKLILTPTKKNIMFEIDGFCSSLVSGEYVEKSGNASRLLFGEKGIGKSNTLRFAAIAIGAKYPDQVIPIYVEYVGSSSSFEFPSVLLSRVLGLPENYPLHKCLMELEHQNKYVFLMVDEIDQIYMSLDDEKTKYRILAELAELGSQRSGRVFTMLCGSAACTPLLISKNAVHEPSLVAEYPIVANAQNLNGSKYSPLRVSRDISRIAEEYTEICDVYNLSAKYGSALYFMSGSNLRTVDKVIECLHKVRRDNSEDQQSIGDRTNAMLNLVNPPKLWDIRARKTLKEHKAIVTALNNALINKNYKILLKVYQDHQSVREIDWLHELRYLSYDEIRTAAISANIHDYQLVVNSLVDKGYFSGNPELTFLGPGRPLDLMYALPLYVQDSWYRRVEANVMGIATDISKEARGELIRQLVGRIIVGLLNCW